MITKRNNLIISVFLAIFSLLVNVKISQANPYLKDAQLLKQNLKNIQNNKNSNYHNYLQDAQSIAKQTTIKTQDITVKEKSYLQSLKHIKPDYDSIQDLMPNIDLESLKNPNHKNKQPINQLLIFISSSLPRQSLINYANSARRSGAVLVLRGLINDSMKQTVKFIHNLSGQGTYAIIDPISYRNFNITQVPTIVLISDDHKCQYGKCTQTPRHDRISGNITLNYALRQFKTNGDFKQEANRYLSALQTREVGR